MKHLTIVSAIPLLACLVACGSTYDLGSDTRPGCEGVPRERIDLTTFSERPGFYAEDLAVIDGYAYVGGHELAPGEVGPVHGSGRVYRIPLGGGPLTEVWRGSGFREGFRVEGTRLGFVERSFIDGTTKRVFGGVNVIDTKTLEHRRYANAEGRSIVTDFVLVPGGVVFAGASTFETGPDSRTLYRSGTSVVLDVNDRPRMVKEIEEERERPLFLTRDGQPLAVFRADTSPTGLDDTFVSKSEPFALFAVRPEGLALEHRRLSLGTGSQGFAAIGSFRGTAYIAQDTGAGWHTSVLDPATSPIPETLVRSFGPPTLYGSELTWLPVEDRSQVRTTSLVTKEEREEVFDARRQIAVHVLDACRVTWLSRSNVDKTTPVRLVTARRP